MYVYVYIYLYIYLYLYIYMKSTGRKQHLSNFQKFQDTGHSGAAIALLTKMLKSLIYLKYVNS